MNEEMNYIEKLAKGIITDEEIEKMVDMHIPIEKDSVLNIIGYVELLKENQLLKQQNAELEKETQMLKLTVEKLTKTPYQYDIRGS